MRFRNYTLAEIYSASLPELEQMHANNLRAIQLLDFIVVASGSAFVLGILDMLHV